MEDINKMENTNINTTTVFDYGKNASISLEGVNNYIVPTFKASYGGKYIQWLDQDGKMQWPEKLMELKNNSALHGRLCRSIVQQICGSGFLFDVSSAKSLATETFLNETNEDGQNLYQVFKKFANDEYIIGMGSLLIAYEKNKKTVTSVQYIPVSKLRAAPVDEEKQRIPGWYYLYDWGMKTAKSQLAFIPSNNFLNQKSAAKQYEELVDTMDISKQDELDNKLKQIENIFISENNQVLVHAPSIDTLSFYYPSLPVYVGALSAIRTAISIGKYNTNSIENGLNIDSIMNVFGITSDAAKLKFGNELYAQYRNPNRGKQTLLTFSPDKEHAPVITPINTNTEDRLYSKINENIIQDILTAHGVVSPLLAGIKTAGQLGGATELKEAAELFYKLIVKPLQEQMLIPINDIMRYNELLPLTIEELKITPQTVETPTPQVKPAI